MARPSRRRLKRRVDVAVVGAGLAGLAAAEELRRAGRSVAVIEARRRVGGRIKNWRCGPDTTCDCGQLIHPRHKRIPALAKELGVGIYPQHLKGNDVIYAGGARIENPASGSLSTDRVGTVAAPDAALAFRQLDEWAKTLPPDAPWEAQRATEWDSITVETWARNAGISSPGGRVLLEFIVYFGMAAEPGEVSLLHLLTFVASLGEGNQAGKAQDALDFALLGKFADGGLQQIPDGIAARLGNRVVLGSPVRRIVQKRRRVLVRSDRVDVIARRVIVATAPALNSQIFFRPPLPAPRAQLAHRYPQGSITTFTVTYPEPFWRDQGYTGRGIGLDPLLASLDISPPSGKPGILVGVLTGAPARRHAQLPAEQRKQAVLGALATFFGDRALRPRMMLERDWSGAARDASWVDQLGAKWTRGCPGFLQPGVMLDYGPAIRKPFGRVFWASAEHSTSWYAAHEGAVLRGEHVAREVLRSL